MSDKTPNEAMKEWVARMVTEQSNWDTEEAHGNADDILCEALEFLGAKELVSEFKKVRKWYA